MDQRQINQEVQTLFQQSNDPNIYFLDFKFYQSLDNLKPRNIQQQQSIQIMMGFTNIVLHLKTNKFSPCQIKFSYVGCDKQNNWGFKHVICYRTIKPLNILEPYDATQILYHKDQDNELIWNLGKIWLRFYSDKKITPIDTSQHTIHQVIDKSVGDQNINRVIKKMLTIKKQERTSFEEFLLEQIFSVRNSQHHLYSSICIHFQMVSKNQKVTNSLTNKKQIKSPYEEQVFRRDLQQSLDICYLLQKAISYIKNSQYKHSDIEFFIFMIKAEAYCLFKKLDQKKVSNHIIDYTVQQKKIYSKFVTKMITLKQQLQRKLKMKIFYGQDGLTQQQRKFLVPTQQMDSVKIHHAFKQIIVDYYMKTVSQLKQTAKRNLGEKQRIKRYCILQIRCITFLLTRLCNQIFSQLRTFVYDEFIKRSNLPLKILNIKQLLQFIQTSQDPIPLKLIRNKVLKTGLRETKSIITNHEKK